MCASLISIGKCVLDMDVCFSYNYKEMCFGHGMCVSPISIRKCVLDMECVLLLYL
jgi:hypothetical protein